MSSYDKEGTKDGIVWMDGRRGAEPSLFVVEPRPIVFRAKAVAVPHQSINCSRVLRLIWNHRQR